MLPLAAALSIPLTTTAGAPPPGRDHVLLLTSTVIATTLLVQGFTPGPLVSRVGIALPADHAAAEHAVATAAMARAALARLDELDALEAAPPTAIHQARHLPQARLGDDENGDDSPADVVLRQLRPDLIAVEAEELSRLYQDGTIGPTTFRQLQRRLDLEQASLDTPPH